MIDIPCRLLLVVFYIGWILFGTFQNEELKTKEVQDAIDEFGMYVKVPTYFPFERKKEYGWINKERNQLQLSYQKGLFSGEITIYVSPKKPLYFQEIGETILLFENIVAVYTEDDGVHELFWEDNELFYSLLYVSNDLITKDEFLSIARSME